MQLVDKISKKKVIKPSLKLDSAFSNFKQSDSQDNKDRLLCELRQYRNTNGFEIAINFQHNLNYLNKIDSYTPIQISELFEDINANYSNLETALNEFPNYSMTNLNRIYDIYTTQVNELILSKRKLDVYLNVRDSNYQDKVKKIV